MTKEYTLYKQAKTKDFAFSIDMLEHNNEVHVHTHDCAELVIILEGKAVHFIDGYEYPLKPGDVFVIHTGSQHGYKKACGLKLSNIMFDFEKLVNSNNELKQLPGFQSLFILEPFYRNEHKFESKLELSPVHLNFVNEMLNLLLKEYNESNDGFRETIKTYFQTLITYLSRQYSTPKNIVSEKLYNLANAIAYMENNFLEPVNINEVASMAYLSTRQFTRVFRENYNTSPKRYIIRLRMDYACKLMTNSNMTLSMIAMESGFSDISFFSRQFKDRFGMSPKYYRKEILYRQPTI